MDDTDQNPPPAVAKTQPIEMPVEEAPPVVVGSVAIPEPVPVNPSAEVTITGVKDGDGVALTSMEHLGCDPDEPAGPPITHEFWSVVKDWVRREVALSQRGADEDHRRQVNP